MAVARPVKRKAKHNARKQEVKRGVLRRVADGITVFLFGEGSQPEELAPIHNVPMLADYVPYVSYDSDNRLFINRAGYGFVIEIAPMVGADEQSGEIIGQLFSDGMPAGTHVQINYVQSARIGASIADWLRLRFLAGGVFFRAAGQRARHLRNGAFRSLSKDAPFFLRHHRILISVSAPIDGAVSKEMMLATRDSMVAVLASINVPSRDITPVELIGYTEDVIFQTRDTNDAPAHYNELEPIGPQCVRRDIVTRISEHRLVIKGPRNRSVGLEDDGTPAVQEVSPSAFDVRFYSVRNFPPLFAPWDVQKLIGDMFNDKLRFSSNVMVSLNLRYLDEEAAQAKAGYKRLRTGGLAESKSAKFLPSIGKQSAEWNEVDQLIRQGKKLVQAYYCVGSVAPLGKGDAAERTLKAVYKAAQWDLSDETFLQMHGFLTMLPCTLADGLASDLVRMRRFRTFPSNVVASIAPLQGEATGGANPHLLLIGRRGQPFYWSPFQNKSGNHNVAVFGKSGSGKSVMLQELCCALAGAGAKIIVIDDGRSFAHMCRALGGDLVEFRLSAQFCLNPFSMIDEAVAAEDEDYEVDGLAMLKQMVAQMARQTDRLNDTERGLIDSSVNAVWRELKSKGSIEAVATALRADSSPFGRELADSLRPFCAEGTYGRFFEGQCSIDLDSHLTVFELSDLASREELRSVVLSAIMFLSQQKMRRMDRSIPKMMLIDEAWQMLKGGAMADFIETYARTCRKYGSALVTATQSFNDFYKSEGSLAALENSDWTLALAQKDESINDLLKNDRFQLGRYMEAVLRSTKTNGTEYSEVLVTGPETQALGRLVLDAYSATLYSSSPRVFQEIESLVEGGVPIADAIEAVAYPDGPLATSLRANGLPEMMEAAE